MFGPESWFRLTYQVKNNRRVECLILFVLRIARSSFLSIIFRCLFSICFLVLLGYRSLVEVPITERRLVRVLRRGLVFTSDRQVDSQGRRTLSRTSLLPPPPLHCFCLSTYTKVLHRHQILGPIQKSGISYTSRLLLVVRYPRLRIRLRNLNCLFLVRRRYFHFTSSVALFHHFDRAK